MEMTDILIIEKTGWNIKDISDCPLLTYQLLLEKYNIDNKTEKKELEKIKSK